MKKRAALAFVLIGVLALATSISWHRHARQERILKIQERNAVDTRPQDEVDRKLRQLAGVEAMDCGRVWHHGAALSIRCALHQFSREKPFYVRISTLGFDGWGSEAFASDTKGKLYYVKFQSNGVESDQAQANTEVFYYHTAIVFTCPKPSHLYKLTPAPVYPIFPPPADPWWIRWPSNLMGAGRNIIETTQSEGSNSGILTCF